jgi:hypothetical protein
LLEGEREAVFEYDVLDAQEYVAENAIVPTKAAGRDAEGSGSV